MENKIKISSKEYDLLLEVIAKYDLEDYDEIKTKKVKDFLKNIEDEKALLKKYLSFLEQADYGIGDAVFVKKLGAAIVRNHMLGMSGAKDKQLSIVEYTVIDKDGKLHRVKAKDVLPYSKTSKVLYGHNKDTV